MGVRPAAAAVVALALAGCGLSTNGAGPGQDGGVVPPDASMGTDGPEDPMDTGTDPGLDSGGGVDTGSPPGDSGIDTGSRPPDAGRDAGRRDASPDGPPSVDQGVQCGAVVCAPPLGCCLAGNTCTNSVGCTAGIGAWLPCDDKADCTGGEVCCASVHASGSVNSVQCMTASACAAIGAGNSGYELCDPGAPVPCTGGLTCGSNASGASELNAYDTCQ